MYIYIYIPLAFFVSRQFVRQGILLGMFVTVVLFMGFPQTQLHTYLTQLYFTAQQLTQLNISLNAYYTQACTNLANLIVWISITFVSSPRSAFTLPTILHAAPRDDGALLLSFAQSVVDKHFASFMSAFQAMGWVTSHHLLGVEEWRYHWIAGGQSNS